MFVHSLMVSVDCIAVCCNNDCPLFDCICRLYVITMIVHYLMVPVGCMAICFNNECTTLGGDCRLYSGPVSVQ